MAEAQQELLQSSQADTPFADNSSQAITPSTVITNFIKPGYVWVPHELLPTPTCHPTSPVGRVLYRPIIEGFPSSLVRCGRLYTLIYPCCQPIPNLSVCALIPDPSMSKYVTNITHIEPTIFCSFPRCAPYPRGSCTDFFLRVLVLSRVPGSDRKLPIPVCSLQQSLPLVSSNYARHSGNI
jgi:hypothetical protein